MINMNSGTLYSSKARWNCESFGKWMELEKITLIKIIQHTHTQNVAGSFSSKVPVLKSSYVDSFPEKQL